MTVELTPEQAAEILPRLEVGTSLVARICREAFCGSNPGTSGRLLIEFVAIPNESLPALRAFVVQARNPPVKKSKRSAESLVPG